MEEYINNKKKKESQLKERDKIYLLLKNLRSNRLSKKLNYKRINLFRIKKRINRVSFELELLIRTEIHPVFYISLLEFADLKISISN